MTYENQPQCQFIATGNRFVTPDILRDLARKGQEWGYNRQLEDSLADEVGAYRYPVHSAMTHHHKQGELCEEHIRAAINFTPIKELFVAVDMPKDYWDSLPRWQPMKEEVIP